MDSMNGFPEYNFASQFWNIFFYISIVLAIVIIILLIVLRPQKNVFLHPYHEDIIFKEFKDSGVYNRIYSTHGEINNYIKRYAIRKSVFDSSIVCNYVDTYNVIKYFVVSYNSFKQPIGVVEVTERKNASSSKIISIPKRSKYVNIIIKSVNGLEINRTAVKPLPTSKIRLFALLMSLLCFNILYIISRLTLMLVGYNYMRVFNKTYWNFFAFLAMILFAILVYFFTVMRLRKKSSKNRNGGLEYEFY